MLAVAATRAFLRGWGPWLVLERNVVAWRRRWWVLAAGFLEPPLYLLAIGVEVGDLVGGVELGGQAVSYAAFVAPAMLATAAMNAALAETTMNFYYKLRIARIYHGVLATPIGIGQIAVGETLWALSRSSLYATAFVGLMAVMGLVESAWAILLVPAALLVGLCFTGIGMFFSSQLRNWNDLERIQLFQLPLFILSATFVPISDYPPAARWVVEATPLYRGVALMRDLSLGTVSWRVFLDIAYLVVVGGGCLWLASRRMRRTLVP